MNTIKVGILAGSLRKDSYSRKLGCAIMKQLPTEIVPEHIELDRLDMFNQDFEEAGRTPQSWKTFREKVAAMDAYLFITPEYNRSYPAVIKNALDIASRPYGENLWDGKPAGILSISPGSLGAFGANQHLRQVLLFLNIHLLTHPEISIPDAANVFDASGDISKVGVRELLGRYVSAYTAWIHRMIPTRP